MQSVFSWAPKVVRKCESKHWFSCGADSRSGGQAVGHLVYGHVITKFSGMGRFSLAMGLRFRYDLPNTGRVLYPLSYGELMESEATY